MPFFKSTAVLFLFVASTLLAQQSSTENAVEATKSAVESTAAKSVEAAKPTLVKVEDISKHVGQVVVVEYDVLSTSLIDSKKICFLNSRKKWRDKGNFATIIKSDVLAVFANAKIPDPAKHYYQKRVRVQGKVTLHRENPQIVVSKVDQITVLKRPQKAITDASTKLPDAGNAIKAE